MKASRRNPNRVRLINRPYYRLIKPCESNPVGMFQLKGVQAHGQHVQATIAGKLGLESMQNTTAEEIKSSNLSLGVGMLGRLSLNLGNQKQEMAVRTANVSERTVLQAGQGGFVIEVGKATHLIGAGIHSEASAGQNRLTADTIQTRSLENQARYEKS